MTTVQAVLMAVISLASGAVGAVAGNGTLIALPLLSLTGTALPMAGWSNGVGLLTGSLPAALGVDDPTDIDPTDIDEPGNRTAVARWSAVVVAIAAASGTGLMIIYPPADLAGSARVVLLAVPIVLTVLGASADRRCGANGWQDNPLLALLVLAGGAGLFAGYVGAGQAMVVIAAVKILPPELARLRGMQYTVVVFANVLSVGALLLDGTGLPGWALLVLAVGSIGGGILGVCSTGRVPTAVGQAVVVLASAVALVKITVIGG